MIRLVLCKEMDQVVYNLVKYCSKTLASYFCRLEETQVGTIQLLQQR